MEPLQERGHWSAWRAIEWTCMFHCNMELEGAASDPPEVNSSTKQICFPNFWGARFSLSTTHSVDVSACTGTFCACQHSLQQHRRQLLCDLYRVFLRLHKLHWWKLFDHFLRLSKAAQNAYFFPPNGGNFYIILMLSIANERPFSDVVSEHTQVIAVTKPKVPKILCMCRCRKFPRTRPPQPLQSSNRNAKFAM